eukprot:959630-Amphidinium_carterae.1
MSRAGFFCPIKKNLGAEERAEEGSATSGLELNKSRTGSFSPTRKSGTEESSTTSGLQLHMSRAGFLSPIKKNNKLRLD